MSRLSATHTARAFSDVLNRVAAGEEIEITRNGAIVAVLSPPKRRFLSGVQWRDLMESLPPVDEDFADDLRAVRASVGPPPSPWPS
jgi:prevent-host-death family protein